MDKYIVAYTYSDEEEHFQQPVYIVDEEQEAKDRVEKLNTYAAELCKVGHAAEEKMYNSITISSIGIILSRLLPEGNYGIFSEILFNDKPVGEFIYYRLDISQKYLGDVPSLESLLLANDIINTISDKLYKYPDGTEGYLYVEAVSCHDDGELNTLVIYLRDVTRNQTSSNLNNISHVECYIFSNGEFRLYGNILGERVSYIGTHDYVKESEKGGK